MKKVLVLLLITLACKQKTKDYTVTIVNENTINTAFLKTIDEPEKALISWYLYAYGNECKTESTKNKCKILKELNITNECDSVHLNNLKKWFSADKLAVYKLNKCPNLSSKSAIQNSIDKIVLTRKKNTLLISYKIKGINNSQEKSWNLNRKETYLIKNNTLQRVKKVQ